MKKTVYISIWSALIAVFGTSCADVTDINPPDRFSPATIWSTTTTADVYATGFYALFRDEAELYKGGYTPWMSDAFSDILKSTSWDQYNHPYNNTLLRATAFNSTGAGALDAWGHYDRIRRQNEFLRDAHYGEKFGADWIGIRIAEVRFCRAYAYYLLCRVYGGVILRTEVDGPEQNDKARSTEADCWKFIIDELQAAAAVLPVSWDEANFGRATKQAAYALLSRVALHAEAWDVAAQAAEDCKTHGGKLDTSGYANVFSSSVRNVELCFAVDFKAGQIIHHADTNFRPSGDGATSGKTITSSFVPTGELADAYEMADGTPFGWSTHGSDPYAGREPRFYATILYNGAEWEGRTIESFVGGKDGFKEYVNSGSAATTVSGYYFRKYLREGDTGWIASNSTQYWILVRYAEVLLNKAEALAQQGDLPGALAALNEVRARVGLPARGTTGKDQFMEYLRHERVVELAGEGQRYWDLRRWRLAVDVINDKTAHGVKITKVGDTFNYEQVEIDGGEKRIFLDRYYRLAIPESERSKNKLCTNNEGWI